MEDGLLGEDGCWRGRPPQVWTLAVMALLGAAMCLLSALRPMTGQAPTALNAAVAVVGAALAAGLWRSGAGVPRNGLHGALLICVASASLLVARSATAEGAMGGAFAFMWMAVYAAMFFPRRVARRYVALLAVSLAVALLANAPRGGLMAWLIVVTSSAAAAEMLSFLHGRMRALAVTDPLTGLLNRGGLLQVAPGQIALALRTGTPLSLAVIDLNGFKLVNDRDGHAAGDRLLVDLARRWTARLRAGDTLARQGGDEFVLLLPATGADDAGVLLDRLRRDSPIAWACGVVQIAPGDDLDSALARADRLMYEHKHRRRASTPPLVAAVRQGHKVVSAQ